MTTANTAPKRSFLARLLGILLPLLIIAGAIAGAAALVASSPKAERQPPPQRQARLVETLSVSVETAPVEIEVMGSVGPARSASLRARVSGQIVEVSPQFMPGGRFEKNDVLLRIDPRDYELALQRQQSALTRVEVELRLEQANAAVAQREYQALGEEIAEPERSLVLREPQLRQIQADVDSARANVAAAQLDLERTRVRAPFSGMLVSRQVNLGDQADGAQALGVLAATDAYWVTVSVPVSQLRWIDIPRDRGERGSKVRIYYPEAWGEQVYREGYVLRLEGALEEQGRMARLLVEVPDPLGLAGEDLPPLLLGAYVRARIEGRMLENVVSVLPGLVQADNTVRVMNAEGKLELRPVTVAHRSGERVLITGGLSAGERVVTTSLSGAVDGMRLRTAEPAETRHD